MCDLATVSRASFYRHWEKEAPTEAEVALRDAIQRIAVAHRFYVRLLAEFVDLAVVLDAFSRRAVGWALARNLQTPLPLAALEHAIASRQSRPG